MMQFQEHRRVLYAILIIGLICVSMIVLTAYATELRVDNNKLISNIDVLQTEVDTLNVRIKQANNIEHIEEVATKELGMVYPDSAQYVYLAQENTPVDNLAMTIKENAYS